ncbi:MAG: T9SS type A sorting domain-containing protein [Bacteroidetes bacterium]|nr:T9SS type A sorting domain-containing protein [Bacteroidota bacterium]MBS1930888.1 T9SS type A sorting domain-containing protein [Bacteroidota bacterium]
MKKFTLTSFKKSSRSLMTVLSVLFFLFAANNLFAQVNPPAPPAPKPATNNCTPEVAAPCPAGSFSANFQNGSYFSGNNGNHNGAGAVWRYTNVANIGGQQINATVKIDTIYNTSLSIFDNDNAVDQNNNTNPGWFAPSIAPNSSLGSTSRRGYVQFTFTFFKDGVGDNYTDSAKLLGINYTHYDIDGTSGTGWSLRETGLVESVPQLLSVAANANTELVAYNYTIGTKSWKGFAASTTTRDGTTSCSEVSASFKYNSVNNPVSSISVRMGYEYARTSGTSGGYGSTARLYASKFGCFNFPQEIPLPVKLLSFSGSNQNKTSLLNWQVADEVNFDHYDIERSSNGYDFSKIGTQQALGTASGTRTYQYSDDLSSTTGNIFYYRLNMVDIDGKSRYSNVIMIRMDQKTINGISIVPNPVSNGMATVRLSASNTGTVELRVIDLTGKVILRQQNKVYEGNNSISLNNLSRLMPGIYTLQLIDGESMTNSKFSLLK